MCLYKKVWAGQMGSYSLGVMAIEEVLRLLKTELMVIDYFNMPIMTWKLVEASSSNKVGSRRYFVCCCQLPLLVPSIQLLHSIITGRASHRSLHGCVSCQPSEAKIDST